MLTDKQADFVSEAQDVLRAGLEAPPYVSVDDTVARRAGKNGFCTQIGNEWFTWFGTRASKSWLNLLELSRAGKHNLSAPLIGHLMAQPQKHFADQTTWQAHLDQFGFTELEVARPGAGRH